MSIKKSDLRQQLKQKRQQINETLHHALSQIIIAKIEILPIFQNSQHIGIYYPIHHEVDVLALFKHCEKNFYLPRINAQNMLEFRQVNNLEGMILNQWGIPEPSPSNPISVPELLIIPMLAYDLNRRRLGYGKGYYDRYLNNIAKPFCLGVAFHIQQVQDIPHESHDIIMDLIITDKKIISP